MKRVVIHPEESQTGKRYWRSLSEFERNPSFQSKLEREFQEGQAEMKSDDEREASRRDFLKLMGASTALAGLAACRRPEAYIKPYAKSPEWVIPGKALFYATSMPRQGGATPLVVTSFEGRPTHLAGNALHPDSNGSVDIYAQASVLDLYDPDRAKTFTTGGKKASKDDFIKALGEKKKALAAAGGKGLAILLDENNSPTRARLVGELKKKFAAAKIYKYEALAPVGATAAMKQAFGDGVVPVYHLEKAERILSLDCDFMGLDRIGNNSTSDFMKGRKAEKESDSMNRLYMAEARYSMTGGLADHRLRVASSQMFKVASELATALGVAGGKGGDVGHPDAKAWIEEAALDLKGFKGKAVVLAGNSQPAEVHLLVAAINNALGAFGPIIELKQGEKNEAGSLADLAKDLDSGITDVLAITEADPAFDAPADLKFADKLKKAKTILVSTRHRTATARMAEWVVPTTHYLEQWGDVRGTDGTYSIVQPMILPLFGGLSDIDVLNLLLDDTPATATALTTPVSMAPAPLGVVEDPGPAMKAVRATFDLVAAAAPSKDDAWNFTLRDGFLGKSAYPAATAAFNAGALASLASFKDLAAPSAAAPEIIFTPCAKVYDGRYINNGWLQEAPDPVSKVTWDNCAMVSVKTAKALGVKREFLSIDVEAAVISVVVNGVTKELPVVVVPGTAENCVVVNVGYGQGTGDSGPGLVGNGTGTNVWDLRTTASPTFATAKISLTEKTSPLALTQEHSSMHGRALVREGTQDDWKHNADFVLEMGSDSHVQGTRAEKKAQQDYTFYKPVGDKDKDGNRIPHLNDQLHQWAMVIDLNRCIGCSTCLVACQSENNIPIVGKEQVIRGREMHWIRMDRYFATDLDEEANPEGSFFITKNKDVWEEDFMDEPEMVVQPVGCQQCESAPCETVCPVNATVHSPDGLNLMVYNRCIGTRYCANNCPFKARRFNFFDYNKRNPLVKSDKLGFEHGNLYDGPLGERWDTELSKLQKNPNVSVRMRGVMEKCTYCLQRIEGARADARSKGRKKAALDSGKFDETLEITNEQIRIPTDSLKVACQQACPADAIMFGNKADDKSTVNKWINNSRNYELLSYLAIKTRTSYLARIKNPNAELLKRVSYEKKKAGNASKLHVGHTVHHTEGTGHTDAPKH
jgi:MoCo/4Fe-4S cofactor protein with predicted Tat translocation signal